MRPVAVPLAFLMRGGGMPVQELDRQDRGMDVHCNVHVCGAI